MATTTEELAQIAYHAYGENAGWKNYLGRPMPSWADLGDTIRSHWLAAIEAARQHIGDDIQAYEPEPSEADVFPTGIAYRAAQERMEAIARNN